LVKEEKGEMESQAQVNANKAGGSGGGNRIFEDYGSNYGSYGGEDDDYYEDLVGVDEFDDDWNFEREPKDKEGPAAGM